jgi:hypothetical protein
MSRVAKISFQPGAWHRRFARGHIAPVRYPAVCPVNSFFCSALLLDRSGHLLEKLHVAALRTNQGVHHQNSHI